MPKDYVDLGEVANNALNAFYMAKNFKQQRKDKQNDVIIQAAMQTLNDPTIPLKRRNDIYNSIISHATGKNNVDFAGQSGLRDLENEDIQVGVRKETVPTLIGSTPNTNTEQTPVGNSGETIGAPPIPIYGSKNKDIPILKKRGDLSPLDLQTMAKKAQDDEQTANDLKKIMLQKTILTNYEPYINNKSGKTVWVNKNNPNDRIETDDNLLPANTYGSLQRSEAPKGLLGELINSESIRLGKPKDDPEVLQAAQEKFQTTLDANNAAKQAQLIATTQTIEGTRPPTPEQKIDDERANREEQLRIGQYNKEERQRALNVYQDYSIARAAKEEAFSNKNRIGEARQRYKDKGEEILAKIQSYENAGVKPTDKRLVQLKKDYENNAKNYQEQDDAYTKANGAETEALNKMNAAASMAKVFGKHLKVSYGNNNYPVIDILDESTNISGMTDEKGKTYGGGEAYIVTDGVSFSSAQLESIRVFRKNNPDLTNNKSDAEVANIIRTHINKKKK